MKHLVDYSRYWFEQYRVEVFLVNVMVVTRDEYGMAYPKGIGMMREDIK